MKIYAFSQEKEVMEFVSLPKKSPERRAITMKLRYRGNLKHNVKTIQSSAGLLIAAKGMKKKGAVNNKMKTQIEKKYSLCVACEGTYVQNSYYRHRCVQFESKKSELGTDAVKAKHRRLKQEKNIFTTQKGISGREGRGRYFYNPEGRQRTLFS